MKIAKKWWILITLIVIIIAIRVALPEIILFYVNGKLRDIPKYSGHIRDIDLHLIRGNYEIKDVELVWLKGQQWVQIVDIPTIQINTIWKKIFQGKAVAAINIEKPVLNIYERMVKPVRPGPKKEPITEVFRELTPLKIETFTIRDAEIRYRNYYTEPNYVLYADSVYITIKNLTNMQKQSSPTYASMDLTGTVMQSGKLRIHALFNPIQTPPDFYVAMKMDKLNVNALDTFSRAYGGFDFEKGTFSLATEITVKDKKITGYAKPVFRDLEVFNWDKDSKGKKEDALKAFWEGIVGATSEVFENQPRDQLATRITLSGTLDDPDLNIFSAVTNVLRDAFIKAFMPTIEGSVKPPNKK